MGGYIVIGFFVFIISLMIDILSPMECIAVSVLWPLSLILITIKGFISFVRKLK